jgi:hypothetical protein
MKPCITTRAVKRAMFVAVLAMLAATPTETALAANFPGQFSSLSRAGSVPLRGSSLLAFEAATNRGDAAEANASSHAIKHAAEAASEDGEATAPLPRRVGWLIVGALTSVVTFIFVNETWEAMKARKRRVRKALVDYSGTWIIRAPNSSSALMAIMEIGSDPLQPVDLIWSPAVTTASTADESSAPMNRLSPIQHDEVVLHGFSEDTGDFVGKIRCKRYKVDKGKVILSLVSNTPQLKIELSASSTPENLLFNEEAK